MTAHEEIAEPSEVDALNTLLARLSLIPHADLIQLAAAAIATCPDAEHRRQFAAAADKAATAAEDERASSLALKAHVEAAGPAEVHPMQEEEPLAELEPVKGGGCAFSVGGGGEGGGKVSWRMHSARRQQEA